MRSMYVVKVAGEDAPAGRGRLRGFLGVRGLARLGSTGDEDLHRDVTGGM